ncbi:hypothetical protein [Hominenteromicrobium sp.]|uniref:hypothetical protein n=1 Tax=Hominenteromicrobium sp. TaxID=3073581 RepID=UPI003999E77C
MAQECEDSGMWARILRFQTPQRERPVGQPLQVTSRGYMLGYTDLKDPSVSGFFRFLAKIGDGMMKMQIVKIGFGGKQ